jgi:hypothetical protein
VIPNNDGESCPERYKIPTNSLNRTPNNYYIQADSYGKTTLGKSSISMRRQDTRQYTTRYCRVRYRRVSPRSALLNLGINTHRPSIDNLYQIIFHEYQLCQLPVDRFIFSAFSSASIPLQQLTLTEIHLTTSFEIHSLKSSLFPHSETIDIEQPVIPT